jgi:hypothetical protein
MSTYYEVKQGDHLSSIAKAFGFSRYQTIWDDPNNADLKAERVNPNVLYPGDVLFIPDKVVPDFTRPTDKRHKFILNAPALQLRLVLEDIYEKPIADAKCSLRLGFKWLKLTTDGAGHLNHDISPELRDASLVIKSNETPFDGTHIPVRVGHLDPVDKLTGQQARLNNLGYFPGKVGGTNTAAFESAVEEFQCDNGLTVDGICGPQTQAKLKQVHGC